MLPTSFFIGSQQINTVWTFLLLGIVSWLFLFWYESRKDGFDDEKTIDLAFLSLISAVLVYYLLSKQWIRLEILNPETGLLDYNKYFVLDYAVFISSLLPLIILSKYWRWSIYRVLDIHAVALSGLIFFLALGHILVFQQMIYLFTLGLLMILYTLIFKYRGYKLISGLIFVIFLVFLIVAGYIIFDFKQHLLFHFSLFTIGMLALYFRGKKAMIVNRQLPAKLLDTLKKTLLQKSEKLEKSQRMLQEEDAYLREGRTTDNAEFADEAILEDSQKEITDLKINALQAMQIQVKRALARMNIGSYGICEVCGEPIDKARLMAYPEATKCLKDADKEVE